MALLDFFKKKKKPALKPVKKERGKKQKKRLKKEPKKEVKEEVKKEAKKEAKKEVKKEKVVPPALKPVAAKPARRGEVKIAPLVLKSPQITEKATDLKDKNQYVFKVVELANKQEIKKAVEEVYGVDVIKVRTIKIPRTKRRLGRSMGWKKGYKKAVVTLKKGQTIDIMPR